ncbi:MAG: glutaredoxin domain-containing protein [Candidatus Uhrbacteria bacterium]|nr:glutaredoxin domain-containing protein [Candidatus Uhrbacteria bacterium]MDP3793620.1 glutaredoxin domain-containing protein [Candidatus Uhrbacteria bacterium]
MNIKIYSTPTCPYCKLVKDYFKEQGMSFSDIDVANDATAANEMVKSSGQMGVPVIDIDGEIIVGWNKSALEEAIAKHPQKTKQVA